jgi:phosphoribosylformylglycinamidine synthase subunit PurQ / glutaminase
MKVGVLVLPNSTCHRDVINILVNIFELNTVPVWHGDARLPEVSLMIIPDGPGGRICNESSVSSPIFAELVRFASNGGYVLGISQGFELLCSLGLLPGSITENSEKRFVCRNAFIIPDSKLAAPTAFLLRNKALKVPVAHGYGQYQADTKTLASMRVNGQILFRYCNEQGVITESANPNGSVENIAGVCNEPMNIFGIMPRPERAADDELGNTDGSILLDSLIRHIKGNI